MLVISCCRRADEAECGCQTYQEEAVNDSTLSTSTGSSSRMGV